MYATSRGVISAATAILVFALAISDANAQVKATQIYAVRVPPKVAITAPSGIASLTHDRTEADQTFAPERWTVTQNSSAGAIVTFTTEQAFTSTTSANVKRDARLDLALASSDSNSGWTVSAASDQTNYASASEVARVQAVSTAPGNAAFDLRVTFVTGDLFTLAQGDYVTTVTGTIAAK